MAYKKRKGTKRKYSPVYLAVVFILIVAVVLYAYFTGRLDYLFEDDIHGSETQSDKESESSQENVVASDETNLVVKFIDVGQGDCIYINFPDGKNMLIDAGDNDKETEQTIREHFSFDTVFDYVLATHSDSDHIGSLDYVYENYEVLHSFRPYQKSNYESSGGSATTEFSSLASFNDGLKNVGTLVYFKYLKAVKNEKTQWEFTSEYSDFSGDKVYDGVTYGYSVDFLTPVLNSKNDFSTVKYSNTNDYSPYVLLEYAGRRIMFTGDAQTQAEKEFLAKYSDGDYDIDVYKAAHHGSDENNCKEVLSLLKPEYSVISCGEGNEYNHPNQKALDRMTAVGSKIYRTDVYGDIYLTISANGDMEWTFENKDVDYNLNLIPADLMI